MSAILSFFRPIRHVAAAIFKRDLAVRRDEGGLHLVLVESVIDEQTRPKRAPREVPVDRDRKQHQELALIRAQLAALLNEQPETRHTMRHLVFVEQALGKAGLKALHKLPLDVLQRALDQLEGLVTNWSPEGLANLRSKMAVAVLDRENRDPDANGDAYRTAAVLDTVQVAHLEIGADGDEQALAAAYAALGSAAPVAGAVEMQGELGSRSAKAVAAPNSRVGAATEIPLRQLASHS